jgi:hypothetical protein
MVEEHSATGWSLHVNGLAIPISHLAPVLIENNGCWIPQGTPILALGGVFTGSICLESVSQQCTTSDEGSQI